MFLDGADDGIRTRDPHLGKVGRGAGPERSLALTCTFRYDSARFSTSRYTSFFPLLPRTVTVEPWLGASLAASRNGVSASGPATSRRASGLVPCDLCHQGRRQRVAGQPAGRHRARRLGRPQFRQRALQPLHPPVTGDPERPGRHDPGQVRRPPEAPCPARLRLPPDRPRRPRRGPRLVPRPGGQVQEHRRRRLPAAPDHYEHGRGRQTDRAVPMHGQRGRGYPVGQAAHRDHCRAPGRRRCPLTPLPGRVRPSPLVCQLRRGQVLGLQRRHVSMVAPTINVEQEWVVPPGKRPSSKHLKRRPATALLTSQPISLPYSRSTWAHFVSRD
jgi:hypothetical protein